MNGQCIGKKFLKKWVNEKSCHRAAFCLGETEERRDDIDRCRPALHGEGKLGLTWINDNNLFTGLECEPWRGRGGLDDAAGSDNQHYIGQDGFTHHEGHVVTYEIFSEPDDGRTFEHIAARRERKRFVVKRGLVALEIAFGTTVFPERTMETDHVRVAGAFVKAVDILGDESHAWTTFGPSGQSVMRGIGLAVRDSLPAFAIPFPNEFGIGGKGFGIGKVAEVFVAPVAAFSAKGGHAAFGGHAGPGEDEDLVGMRQ